MPDNQPLYDIEGMGDAGLRFAEQFEMTRVLAAFERHLFEVMEEAKVKEADRKNVAPRG